jgi:hypothetical protein
MPDTPLTRNWLTAEWRFILSVVSPIVAVMLTWFSLQTKVELIQQKVATIEGNHLVHIQASMEKLTDAVDKLAISEAENRTLLNQHLNQK